LLERTTGNSTSVSARKFENDQFRSESMGVGLRLDAGTNGANKPTIGHWRADANRAAFFKAPLALLATVAPDAHDDAHADDDDERATHRLQAALSRCAPLFAGDVFAGATDAADKYARASRALDVQSHPRIEAQLRAGPPAGPDRLQLGSERLDEGTLAAILCALAATPSVVRLSLWHSALSAEGWGLLARLLPATAVCALDVSGQSAAGVDKEQWRPDRAALVSSCAPALTLLSVRHCELSSVHGAAALGRAVATHAALLGLDLSGNPLGDDGVIALARALGAGRPLLEGLALTSVRAGDAAAAALAALLAPRRPATADELAAHAAAVAAGLAPPMQVEVAAADGAPAALATTGGGGGGGKNRTAPAAKPAAASTGTKAGAPAKAGAGMRADAPRTAWRAPPPRRLPQATRARVRSLARSLAPSLSCSLARSLAFRFSPERHWSSHPHAPSCARRRAQAHPERAAPAARRRELRRSRTRVDCSGRLARGGERRRAAERGGQVRIRGARRAGHL
jgi:hypothetical protein